MSKSKDLELPILSGTLEEKVKSLIIWIDDNVSRNQWNNSAVDQNFGRRSIRKILSDGNTCYMNPCADLTFVAYAVMKNNSMNPVIVVEELAPGDYPFVRIHFGLEFSSKKDKYFLDFIQLNRVLLGKGSFVNHKKDISAIRTSRITCDISIDDNPTEVVEREVEPKDFNLVLQLDRLKKDNNDDTYRKYLASMPNDGRLYLEKI